jgi:hypothetical protein
MSHRWVTLFSNVMTKEDEPFIPVSQHNLHFLMGMGRLGLYHFRDSRGTHTFSMGNSLSLSTQTMPFQKWQDPGLPFILIGGVNLFMLFQAELKTAGKKNVA